LSTAGAQLLRSIVEIAIVEVWGQFRKTEEEEHLTLEA
jgi:hypothetical protein